MTTGLKVWLWIILVLNVIGIFTSVTAALLVPILWLSVVLGVLIIAGVFLLLFKQRKMGYYLICGAAALSLVYNVAMGVNIISAIISAVLMPLITWLFLKNNWDSFQ